MRVGETFIFNVNISENPVSGQMPPTTDAFAASKIPPRLTDRPDWRANPRTADNLPALKNQLQMAMEMLQEAVAENLAAERRRLHRMLALFALLLVVLFSGTLVTMGWLMLQMQARLAALPLVTAEMPPPSSLSAAVPPATAAPAPVPAPVVPPAPVAAAAPSTSAPVVTAEPPIAAGIDPAIMAALEADLSAVTERSLALDDLLNAQHTRLQSIMDEMMALNTELTPVAPGPEAEQAAPLTME